MSSRNAPQTSVAGAKRGAERNRAEREKSTKDLKGKGAAAIRAVTSHNYGASKHGPNLITLFTGNRQVETQGPEEICLSLEHQNPSKTSETNGLF